MNQKEKTDVAKPGYRTESYPQKCPFYIAGQRVPNVGNTHLGEIQSPSSMCQAPPYSGHPVLLTPKAHPHLTQNKPEKRTELEDTGHLRRRDWRERKGVTILGLDLVVFRP